MVNLTITDLEGTHPVSTPDELAAVLAHRRRGANHFLISSPDADYPQLDVIVRDDVALLHYFPAEGLAGDQSRSDLPGAPELVEFPENLTGEVIQVPGSAVVDAATAIRCVEEFAERLARPTLIGWLEL
jgi:hypothetical protein